MSKPRLHEPQVTERDIEAARRADALLSELETVGILAQDFDSEAFWPESPGIVLAGSRTAPPRRRRR
jgi:hypothetical protein